MNPDSVHDRLVMEEIERIRAQEREKQMLLERDQAAPRLQPDINFITANLGELKSEAQIRQEAEAKVWEMEKVKLADLQKEAAREVSKWGDLPLSEETRRAGEAMREQDRQDRQISDDFSQVR
jgi:hypothetical protein